MLRDLRRAEVVGDVPMQVLRPQPKRAIGFRQGIAGVVAQDEEAGRCVAVDAPICLAGKVFLLNCVQASLRAPSRAFSLFAFETTSGKKKA